MTTGTPGSDSARTNNVSAAKVIAWTVGLIVAGAAFLVALPALQAFFMALSAR